MNVYETLCGPAKLYAYLAFFTLIYIILKQNTNYVWFGVKAFIFICWVFVLNFMCKKGYRALAWVLAVLPQIIFIVGVEPPKVKS